MLENKEDLRDFAGKFAAMVIFLMWFCISSCQGVEFIVLPFECGLALWPFRLEKIVCCGIHSMQNASSEALHPKEACSFCPCMLGALRLSCEEAQTHFLEEGKWRERDPANSQHWSPDMMRPSWTILSSLKPSADCSHIKPLARPAEKPLSWSQIKSLIHGMWS